MQQPSINLIFNLRLLIFYFKSSLFLFIVIIISPVNAQNNFPQNYFRSPLDITPLLAATFGEPRENHFHSGLDLKTFNKEGLPVHAVADGYVSRIKISPNGYGKAIYITHPEFGGYVSVYGHLQKFNTAIGNHTLKKQYEKESFEIDLALKGNELPVKKGDIIAFSGNSGGSSAPHLHFEIRNGITENPMNALLFGLKVQDNITPVIEELEIYFFDNPLYTPTSIKMKNVPSLLKINADKIGFGIKTFDQSDQSDNRNGIYSLEMKMDNTTLYSFKMNEFSFADTRFANAHCDFSEYKINGSWFYKCFLSEYNELKIYDSVFNRGIVDLSDNQLHNLEISVKDFAGNQSFLKFLVQKDVSSVKQTLSPKKIDLLPVFLFGTKNKNYFQNEEINLQFPTHSFYDPFYFQYSNSDTSSNDVFSLVHHVHNFTVPLNHSYSVAIKTKNLPESLKNKVILVCRDGKGKISTKGGNIQGESIVTTSREFGDFFVVIDTVPPNITPQNISNPKKLSREKEIRIKISDELSGIKSYRATVDGKWILMDYDAKNNLLIHHFDNDELPLRKIEQGEHQLILTLQDERKNQSVLTINFIR